MLRRIMKWLTGFPEGKQPEAASSSKERPPFLPPASPVHHPDCRTGCRSFFLAQPVHPAGRGKSGPGAEPDHGPAENRSQDGSAEKIFPPGRTEADPCHEQTNRRSSAPACPASGPRAHRSQGQGPDSAHDPAEGEISGAHRAAAVSCQRSMADGCQLSWPLSKTIRLQLFPDYNTI